MNINKTVCVLLAPVIFTCIPARMTAQFDTEPCESSEVIGCIDSVSLRDVLSAPPVPITRLVTNFQIGLNWFGMDGFSQHFGVGLIDNHINLDPGWSNEALKRYPVGSRLILVQNEGDRRPTTPLACAVTHGHSLMQGEGYTLMTRLDPEIMVDSITGLPIIESDTNTGAVHGFRVDSVGMPESHWRQLRTTQVGTLSGNTNARMWKTHNPEWLRFKAETLITDTNGTHVEMRKYADPTRNGEFMVVSICVRRSGPIDMEDLDTPIIKLRILRQQRVKKVGSSVSKDSRAERYLRFSFIPRTDVDDSSYADYAPRQVGVDSLPRLFMDLELGASAESTSIESKLEGDSYPYEEMPLALSAEVSPSLSGRELVWQYTSDVRDVEGNPSETPDAREQIIITGRMLAVLPDDPHSAIGNAEDQYDGESKWTLFEGLIVLGATDPGNERSNLFVFDNDNPDTNKIYYGLSSKEPNLRFVQNGPRGNADSVYSTSNPGVITDLELEVDYLGAADVDVDYITFQTPNTRALLRDQYRSRVSRQIAETITQLGKELTEDTTLIAKNFTIFGVRSHEEEGELCWYGQRYLNILTNGLMISEIDNKPYDRYRHIAYPFESTTGTYPEHPLPLWVWNEGSTGRLDPFTPVPFLRNGAVNRGSLYTHGYKAGLSKGQYYTNNAGSNDILHDGDNPVTVDGWLMIGATPVHSAVGVQNRRMATDDYTIGYPCSNFGTGGASGQFDYYASAFAPGRKPQLWNAPRWLEHKDLDSLSENNSDPSTSCSGLDLEVQLSNLDRPPTIKLSTSLYSEFLSPGNSKFLFSNTPWLEQVWLGTDKVGVHWPIVGQTDSLATVLMSRGDQSRPYTAEEMRIRMMIPTLLGARGVMLFVGSFPPIPDTVQTMTRVGFPNITNAQAYYDARLGTFNVGSLNTAHYGADFPTYRAGGAFTVDTNAPCTDCGVALRKDLVWKVKTEGCLEAGSMVSTSNGPEPDTLYVSTMGYVSGGGKSKNSGGTWVTDATHTIGGVDVVQRVNDNGTINHTAQNVERVYLGHHSARLELLRYTNWLQGSFLNDSNINWYDSDYRSVPGEHEVAGGTSGSATFSTGDLTYASPTSVAELLARLDLFSWHNRGYSMFNTWRDQDSVDNPLEDWVDLTRIKTRHPYRTFNGRADYEVADSMFVDVMLHKRRLDADTLAYMDEVYLGVSNRRDNPLYMQDLDTTVAFDDQPRFSSTREFFAMVSKPENKHRLYDQLGSRSVLLPFTHAKTATLVRKVESTPGVYTTLTYTTPILLHITEVVGGTEVEREYETLYRNPQDSTQTLLRRRIDTIIDPKAAFELSLLPGEGKLLRVRPIPALGTDDIRGNLAFSTQTKLVVAPEQYYNTASSRWLRTDKVRYHMAYTKSMPVCVEGGEPFLRVCYRRSIPYHRDSVPLVAGLSWEQDEYVFGHTFDVANTVAPQPGTWWQAGLPRFPGVPTGIFMRTHSCDSADLRLRTNAAFPSIAISRSIVDSAGVRDTIQRIHLVYSTLYNIVDDVDTSELHIVETTFIDGVADVDAQQRSSSLAVTQYSNNSEITVDTLLQWGTPTNGISAAPHYDTTSVNTFFSDRVVTAWSVGNNHGISATMRNASLSTTGRTVEYFARDPYLFPATHNTEVIGLTQTADTVAPNRRRAQFPSLTPTSSAVGSQTPAVSLVWQEKACRDSAMETRFDGWAIMYTRLWDPMLAAPSDGLAFGLPGTINQMQYVFSMVPALELFDAGAGVLYGGIYHNMVVRISDDDPGRVSIYPTITRSGLERSDTASTAMTMSVEEPLPTPHFVFFPYQFETVTFQTVALGDAVTRIHRRHFIHEDISQTQAGPGTAMRYWWMNSTTMSGTNLVAPTVANGSYRFDEQNFTPFGSYPTAYVTGNASDTATHSTHGATNGSLLRIDPDDVPSGTLDWKMWDLPRTVWHTHLKYTPIPIHTGGYVAYGDDANSSDRSAATNGIWPHLAHQMLNLDQAKQNVRRIQQDTGSAASSPIFVSAEGFYKRDLGPKWRTKGGYHNGKDVISIGGIIVDGEELTFRRLERSGSQLESMMASIFEPLPDLVTETFTVETIKDLNIDVDGLLREDLELYVDQVNGNGVSATVRSVQVDLPERPQANAKTQRKIARWTLSNGGDGNMYRFRLHPTGTFVVMEDEILEDVDEAFAKSSEDFSERSMVDLTTMRVGRASTMMSLSVAPNPASTVITLVPIVPSHVMQPLRLDIIDVVGARVMSTTIPADATSTVNVSALPSGSYVLQLVSIDGLTARAMCRVMR